MIVIKWTNRGTKKRYTNFENIVNDMLNKAERNFGVKYIYPENKLKAYRREVKRRIKIAYGKTIKAYNNEVFIRELDKIGELKIELERVDCNA